MCKVVYNTCFGGFGLSEQAEKLYEELSGKIFCPFDTVRHDPHLVKVVETLGEKANGDYADLAIFELGGDLYIIREYDGNESVIEPPAIRWINASH